MSTGRFPFTMARLERVTCPPKMDRTYVYDEKGGGLCLMATGGGAKSFYLYRKIGGRPERIRLGAFPDINVDTARELAAKRNGEIANGTNPAEARRAQRGAMKLEELFNHYLDTHAKPHKKSWRADEEQFDRYFGKGKSFAAWRERQVNTIDADAVKMLHVKLGKKHGHYSANRVLAMLSTMFNTAGLPSVTKGIRKFHEEQRERFLDAEELARFRSALDSEKDTTMADYFRLLLFMMQRRGNVAAMKWENVNFGRREWTLPGATTKNGEQLVVSLTDEATDILKRRWDSRTQGDVFVFPGRGVTGHIVEPKNVWANLLQRAKIKDFRLHDLRHTGASWMAIGGSSLSIIGKALGHKSHQSTARYAHVNRTAAAAAAQSATSTMAAMMGGTSTAKKTKIAKKKVTA